MQLFFPEALWRRLPAAAPGRTLRISVTGHRRNRLSAEDSQQAEELLSETLETIGRRWPGEIMLLSGGVFMVEGCLLVIASVIVRTLEVPM